MFAILFNLLAHYTKGTLFLFKRIKCFFISNLNIFSLPFGFYFNFLSQYLYTIEYLILIPLEGGPPIFIQFLPLIILLIKAYLLHYTGLYLFSYALIHILILQNKSPRYYLSYYYVRSPLLIALG